MNKIEILALVFLTLAISGCSSSESGNYDGATTAWISDLTVRDNKYKAVTIKYDELRFPYQSPVIIFNEDETADWKSELIKNAESGRIDFGESKPNITGTQIAYATGKDPDISILTWNIEETKIKELGGLKEYLTFLMLKNKDEV